MHHGSRWPCHPCPIPQPDRRPRRRSWPPIVRHRPTRRSAPVSGAARADEGGDADMSVYREFTGKTVEEALRNAREAFGAGLEDLDFEILTPGTRGVLGMGAEPARIVAAPRAELGGAAPKREAAASQPLPPSPSREDRPRFGDRGPRDDRGGRDRGPRREDRPRFGDRDRDRERGPRPAAEAGFVPDRPAEGRPAE